MTAWPRIARRIPPPRFDLAEKDRLSAELGISRGSWAPGLRVDDPPAGVFEMFGEYAELGEDEHVAVGWEGDLPTGRLAIRARIVRFRPDGTGAYLEARLPGPAWHSGWGPGAWGLSIRGLELERSAVRARRALAAVPVFRAWLGRAVGRPSEIEERTKSYRSQILALSGAGYRPSKITAILVLQRLGRSGDDSQLRADVEGWAAFRARVLAGE